MISDPSSSLKFINPNYHLFSVGPATATRQYTEVKECPYW